MPTIPDQFHDLYYNDNIWQQKTHYRGIPIWKCPLDLWVYQEIIEQTRPHVIIETGTYRGGSALFLADTLRNVFSGQFTNECHPFVITVEIDQQRTPQDELIEYIHGDSRSPAVANGLQHYFNLFPFTPNVMVILDSDHSFSHVMEELKLYSKYVTPGCYLVVEDTNVTDAARAVKAFLATKDCPFTVDKDKEKFLLTFNPDGYLRRKA